MSLEDDGLYRKLNPWEKDEYRSYVPEFPWERELRKKARKVYTRLCVKCGREFETYEKPSGSRAYRKGEIRRKRHILCLPCYLKCVKCGVQEWESPPEVQPGDPRFYSHRYLKLCEPCYRERRGEQLRKAQSRRWKGHQYQRPPSLLLCPKCERNSGERYFKRYTILEHEYRMRCGNCGYDSREREWIGATDLQTLKRYRRKTVKSALRRYYARYQRDRRVRRKIVRIERPTHMWDILGNRWVDVWVGVEPSGKTRNL